MTVDSVIINAEEIVDVVESAVGVDVFFMNVDRRCSTQANVTDRRTMI
jgi:hypothetical protein